jgi:transcriptional regulator with XRE-family HTH domain
MFDNIPLTLSLLRELRRKSQASLARDAHIGKSQLSKYETGRELPKLDSLEKVLNALEISYPEFFYALRLVDRLSSELQGEARDAGGDKPLSMPLVIDGPSLLGETARQAFTQVFSDLMLLHHRMIEQMVLSGGPPQASRPRAATRKRKSSHRAAASSPPRSASPR